MSTEALERRRATWEEYLALGEDVRAEYIDGWIQMVPLPSRRHQNAIDRLCSLLEPVLPDGYHVIRGWGWKPGSDEFGPDVMVFPETDGQVRYTGTLVLCVEVVSSNRSHDYVVKATKYAEAGLDHYWIVDPQEGTLNVLVRRDQHYALDRIVTVGQPTDVRFGIASVHIDLGAVLA